MAKFTSKDLSILSVVERRIKQFFERTDDYKEQIKHIVKAYLKETELKAYLNNLKDVTIISPSNSDQLFYQDRKKNNLIILEPKTEQSNEE